MFGNLFRILLPVIKHNLFPFGGSTAGGLLWLLPLLLIAFTGCEKTPVLDCFVSTGEIVKEERQIGQFQTLVLKDNLNLILRQSNTNRLVVEGGSNLLRKIVTDVENDSVLIIRNDNQCNWVRSFDKPINVYLDFNRLDLIEYRSIGDVTNVDTLRLDSLSVDVREGAGKIELILKTPLVYCNLHYGTADIVLKGIADLSYVFGDGFGRIDNRNLMVSQIYVNNKSSNDMFLNANLRLEATIENIGNIYYSGNPQEIQLQRIGSGELIKID
jgi:hypothetical protein